MPLLEVQSIPGKGRGLVARVDIAPGTRVLLEEPLLTYKTTGDLEKVEAEIATALASLPEHEKKHFLSFHNAHPDISPLVGIVKTNSSPSGTRVGAVYASISLINHSCRPNAFRRWRDDLGCETVHAIRAIKAGEEITVTYLSDRSPSTVRKSVLQAAFGFDCHCPACDLAGPDLAASDKRRHRIAGLHRDINRKGAMGAHPQGCLNNVRDQLGLLADECGGGGLEPPDHGAYFDAFNIALHQGDRARASVFAGRAHDMALVCEGWDAPVVRALRALVAKPTSNDNCGGWSFRWISRVDMVPKGLGEAAFEEWLWNPERSR